jgi:hypothetical protein
MMMAGLLISTSLPDELVPLCAGRIDSEQGVVAAIG